VYSKININHSIPHNEELHQYYSSVNIIRIMKYRRMILVGHAVRMGRSGMHTGFWWESQSKRATWENLISM
jgi:hypothetical protein